MANGSIVVGGTGLIGSEVLKLLAADPAFTPVTALARRSFDAPAGIQVKVTDFSEKLESETPASEYYFCCIGTTIKKAGSQEAFRKVDYDLVINSARAAFAKGARIALVVSALGSDKNSSIFYNRVKGDMEEALQQIGFRTVYVFRPSLLTGDRAEMRPGEKVGQAIGFLAGPLFLGPMKRYKPIAGKTVAAAMVRLAKAQGTGVHFIESEMIAKVASA
ncbi:MAG TPA: NAD-dependent epimerase/dehydratase family protein [Leptospiraceae bacterium]|nr:NAD-dependent epimerase/dehydratase family protein [Leptospirales bacterium]HMU81909.1 NAD-dependent epimerase/dehydratase family protein [Leptospiraceae bacterium]HMW58090.1 NAD-dependent epimerase/dehydratase family protein [Leptospiraceae bacterium]HMX55810.1 NAD-dependent epimerase/dehydratase family protein [Leptospiraceae bacterium]HNE23263.1 NAD-dependent epimerase/dehydratase family protein [Leptospiraceae bacterium]